MITKVSDDYEGDDYEGVGSTHLQFQKATICQSVDLTLIRLITMLAEKIK